MKSARVHGLLDLRWRLTFASCFRQKVWPPTIVVVSLGEQQGRWTWTPPVSTHGLEEARFARAKTARERAKIFIERRMDWRAW